MRSAIKRICFSILFTIFIFMAGCASEEAAIGDAECYYKWDCLNGQVCIEGKCVEDPAFTDNAGSADTTASGDKEVAETDITAINEGANEAAPDSESDVSDISVDSDTDTPSSDADNIKSDIDTTGDADNTADMDNAAEQDSASADKDIAVVPDVDTNSALLTVKTVAPADKSVNIIAGIISIEFSRPVKRDNLEIKFQRDGLTSFETLVPVETQTLLASWTFAITPDYSDAYKYTVTIPSTVQDDNNIALDADYSWYFNVDKNECALSNPCDDNSDPAAICSNTAGSYTCSCSFGFNFTGGSCYDTNECSNANGSCQQTCVNDVGTYHCTCSAGYTLNANGRNCDDNNECATSNGGCNQNCVNDAGSFHCTCNSGYALDNDGKTCINIDECTTNSNPCDNDGDTLATCADTTGSYTCSCSTPFFTFSGGKCIDVNECTAGTHNCNVNANCTNTTGSFSCACKPYYTGDGVTTCAYCNTDGQCGTTCGACLGGTPKCKDSGTTSACVQCLTTGDCASGYECNASNQCVTTVPAEACSTGSQSRDRCSNARIIGRSTAKTSTGYKISDDTCSASDRIDTNNGCWDAGNDHAYRIYLRAGEAVNVNLSVGTSCVDSSWNAMLAIYYSDASCPESQRKWCDDYFSGSTTYTALLDGWYYIIVDGSTAFDDEGDYTLTVKLQNCTTAGCNCP